MRKRILSVLLACVLLFALVPSAHASAVDNFTDISSYMPEYEHILRYIVEAKGDMNGTSATTFAPSAGIKRCDAILTLCRVFDVNLNAYNSYANPFTDVPAGSYYESAVKWAYYEGITSGNSATTFGPNDLVQRQHFCTFFSRFCTKMGVTLPNNGSSFVFSDDSSIGSTHKSHVYKLYRAGIISGTSATTFTPTASIERIHVAKMLFNYYVPAANRLGTPNISSSSITHNSFVVSFPAVPGALIHDIKLMRGNTIVSGWTSLGAGSKTYTGLTANTTYTVHVRAWKPYNGSTLYSQTAVKSIRTCLGTLDSWNSDKSIIGRWGDSPSDIPTTVYTRRISASPNFNAGMSHAISQWNAALGCDMQRMMVSSMPTTAKIGFYGGTFDDLSILPGFSGLTDRVTGMTTYDRSVEGTWCTSDSEYYTGYQLNSVRGCIVDKGIATNWTYKVCTHELGHGLGWFGHSSTSTDVMVAGQSTVTVLTDNDKDHLLQVYSQ
ncbi:MAG: S-layer homology domain-containing protein [Oscillospiraceae bacterium]|jgi:predicted Zn-dependent protease|nr:S-layer homology domain-containing protein [Oscillospiraceae bacterium]